MLFEGIFRVFCRFFGDNLCSTKEIQPFMMKINQCSDHFPAVNIFSKFTKSSVKKK